MQTPNDNILSPDYSDPLNFNSLSHSTSAMYEDDPWTTISNNGSLHFNDYFEPDITKSFINETGPQGFGSDLSLSNVLLGVEVPESYTDIYFKTNPKQGKVDMKALQLILQLAGLSMHAQQLIKNIFPVVDSISRHEFNTFLALIACAQHNMDISLNTVYRYRNDLPTPVITDLESVNFHEAPVTNSVPKDESWETQPETNNNNRNSNEDDMDSSTAEEDQLLEINRVRHLEEQEAMNEWFRDLDHITLTRTMEKEGFLFKHINYQVESEKLGSKVLRRFSDFWWLWEVMLKRYPFRIMPNLPPKKLGGRNEIFEESRRKGLSRFINAIVRHPVLGKDEIVIAFLSHPSEINSWKRANSPSLDEEFVRKSHNIAYIERLIPMDLEDRVHRMKKRLVVSIQQYERMCFIMNQMNRLKKALGVDFTRYSTTLNSVSEADKECWVPGCRGCPEIIRGYDAIAKSMHQAGVLLNKQAIATGDTIVEGLRRQRDLLESFRELLERRDMSTPIPNETLSRQLAQYRKGQKLPSIAHDEAEYIPPSTTYDTSTGLSLNQQRDLYIKYCLVSELSFLHKQQANVSAMYNQFVRDEIKYTRQWSDHWKSLEPITSEMPSTPHEFI